MLAAMAYGTILLHPIVATASSEVLLITDKYGSYSEWRQPYISNDGRYITFSSRSQEIVTGDNNSTRDIFRSDTSSGETIRVTDIKNDGNEVPVGDVTNLGLSADGSRVLFASGLPLSADDTNNQQDIYIRDILNNSVFRVSVGQQGQECNRMCDVALLSSDGGTVIFRSESNNLVEGTSTYKFRWYKHDISSGVTEVLNLSTDTISPRTPDVTDVSGDGRYVIYTDSYVVSSEDGSNHTHYNVRRYDAVTQVDVLVNTNSQSVPANHATSSGGSISDDGRYVSFYSYADNLSTGDTNSKSDVFARDMVMGSTERVSVSSNGLQGNGDNFNPNISSDGRYVVFGSYSNLVERNGCCGPIVYIHDRLNHITRSVVPEGYPGDETGSFPNFRISDNNEYVTYRVRDNLYKINLQTVFADSTPPEINSTVSPVPGPWGWNNSPVQLSWSISDPGSPISSQSGCTTITVNEETSVTGALFTCSVTSGGGTTTNSVTIKYDATNPVISYVYSPAAGLSGWSNSDVMVSFTCQDQLSGINICSSPILLTNEGAGQVAQGIATDFAGNTEQVSVPVNIDKTLPSGVFNGSNIVLKLLGQGISGNAGDGLSGVQKVEILNGLTVLSSDSGQIGLSCDSARTNCTWTVDPTSLTSGAPNFTLRVTDLAGNVFTTTKQYIIL
jgi:hypothetical protein